MMMTAAAGIDAVAWSWLTQRIRYMAQTLLTLRPPNISRGWWPSGKNATIPPTHSTRRSSWCCPKTSPIGSVIFSAKKRSRLFWCCAYHRLLRAAPEPQSCQPCADHGGRYCGCRAPRPLLRANRRPCRDRDGTADLIRRRRGARQKDGAVPGFQLARERTRWPVWRRHSARTKGSGLPARSLTLRWIPELRRMWRSGLTSATVGHTRRSALDMTAPVHRGLAQ
jgi:hypothetical protein